MTTHTDVTIKDLADIVGPDAVWPASLPDAIDGVQASFVVEPSTATQAAEVLRLARGANLAVAPRGQGTMMGWGNPPTRVDLVVSTRRLSRVLEHAAGDLVVRVEAGATLAVLQQELTARGQWLALDPPERDATVGGIIATNAFGPRRLRNGTARDLLIGFTYVLPDGTVATAGGKVVKNVAGYDLGKLFCGSLGTLGLIVEAIFRLHPLPTFQGIVTLHLDRREPAALVEAIQSVLNSSLVPSALLFAPGRAPTLSVMLEGIEPGVEAQIGAARDILARYGEVRRDRPEESGDRWRLAPPADVDGADAHAYVRVSSTLVDLAAVLEHVAASAARGLGVTVRGHGAPPTTYVSLIGDARGIVAAIEELRRRLEGLDAHAVVQQASLNVKQAVDVWGPVGDALPLMRRVKEMFDPTGSMNPGRFVGGL